MVSRRQFVLPEPYIERPFYLGFPEILPRDRNSTFRGWADAIGETFTDYESPLVRDVMYARFVGTADGWALDRIGDRFGPELGARRLRGDDEFRNWLVAIKQAFEGTGTVSDLRLTVANALRVQLPSVQVEEFYAEEGYRLVVWRWNRHDVSTVYTVARKAQPSGYPLLDPDNGIGVTPRARPVPDRKPVTYAFQPAAADAIEPSFGPGLGFGTAVGFAPTPTEPSVSGFHHGEETAGLGAFRFGDNDVVGGRTTRFFGGAGYGSRGYGGAYADDSPLNDDYGRSGYGGSGYGGLRADQNATADDADADDEAGGFGAQGFGGPPTDDADE